MKSDERGFDDQAGFTGGQYSNIEMGCIPHSFNALISLSTPLFIESARRILSSSRLNLTSDNEPGRFGCQRVLRGEVAGCHLALP